MTQQSGDEVASDLRELVGIVGVVEGIAVALEQRHVGVHARPLEAFERLRHEGGVEPTLLSDLSHDEAHRHHVVGHAQRVGVAEVDLVLRRAVLVERVLDRDAHGFEGVNRALAEIGRGVDDGQVEVRARVERDRRMRRVPVREVEELHLRRHVEREAELAGSVEVALEDLTRIAVEGAAVGVGDVAEHPRGRAALFVPRQQLEARGIGAGQHVALLDTAEAVDRRSVEVHALVERVLELGRTDGEGLQFPEHVGEPEADEPHSALLHGPKNVLTPRIHGSNLEPLRPGLLAGMGGDGPVHIPFTLGKTLRNAHLLDFRSSHFPVPPTPRIARGLQG